MKKINRVQNTSHFKLRSAVVFLTVAVLFLGGILLPMTTSQAAAPTAGQLNPVAPFFTPVAPNLTFDGTWQGTGTGPAAPNGEADCAMLPASCDVFILTLGGTLADWNGKRASVRINWNAPATDYDMFVKTGSVTGTQVASSAGGTSTFEKVELDPNALGTLGPFYVRVVYFAATPADQYSGVVSVVAAPPASGPPPPSSCPVGSPLTYFNHQPPSGLAGSNSAGEPSIGVNWNTGNVLFQSNINLLRATFDDTTSPGVPTWASFNPVNQPSSLDPIMFTDSPTGRTIGGQLLAAGGTSASAITDNDGETFLTNLTTGLTSGVDHQTIGAGPYRNGVPPTGATYPRAWYYASQSIGTATLARSDNGGVSYGTAFPMYNLTECSGLHGHVKVAPDGTVYVPNKNCPGGQNGPTPGVPIAGQGVAVSEDNGVTFAIRVIPGSGNGDNDPAVAVGAGGRLYMGYTASDKTIRAAYSDDKGRTWNSDQNIGLPFAIKAAVFPAAVAGDNNRAAIFFLGTDSVLPGDPTGDDATTVFAGTWYPYVATTCNGGLSWSVVRAGDVVQQGVVCTNGTTCPAGTRNLLDFNDVQVDRFGRVLAGYADGCRTAACLAAINGTKAINDKLRYATIIRQTGGPRLFSDFDAGGPAAPPLPPPVEIEADGRFNRLNWATPDSGGSPITGYKIYRGIGEKGSVSVGQVSADTHSFIDRKALGKDVYYQVTVVNQFGESPRTRRFFPNAPLSEGKSE